MNSQTSTVTPAPACTTVSSVFQHPLLEEPTAPATAEQRRQQAALQRRAAQTCGSCPVVNRCLYAAVVEHDVAGFVAGTTNRQRHEIRAMLNVRVQPEDLDAFCGLTGSRQLTPADVLRIRTQNPHDSLETIAERLGCSLSTIKRHLRRARAEQGAQPLAAVRPSLEQVLHATSLVLGRGQSRTAPVRERVAA